jgi:hypothetical protein
MNMTIENELWIDAGLTPSTTRKVYIKLSYPPENDNIFIGWYWKFANMWVVFPKGAYTGDLRLSNEISEHSISRVMEWREIND